MLEWRQGKIAINLVDPKDGSNEIVEIDGHVCGYFGIDERAATEDVLFASGGEIRTVYSITHMPSGYRVASCESLNRAMEFVGLIEPLMNWAEVDWRDTPENRNAQTRMYAALNADIWGLLDGTRCFFVKRGVADIYDKGKLNA